MATPTNKTENSTPAPAKKSTPAHKSTPHKSTSTPGNKNLPVEQVTRFVADHIKGATATDQAQWFGIGAVVRAYSEHPEMLGTAITTMATPPEKLKSRSAASGR